MKLATAVLVVLAGTIFAGTTVAQTKPANKPMNVPDKHETAGPADVIFINANIYQPSVSGHVSGETVPRNSQTGKAVSKQASSSEGTRCTALAVRGDRIIAVGIDSEVLKLKGKSTRVIDVGGKFLMPGFNDAHLHLASGGFEKLNVDLVGTTSLDEMKSRIAARAKTTVNGEWLTGRGWDHTKWAALALPTRQDIDSATDGHPAIFVRVDGHIAIANTTALQAAGITAATKDPQGGKIDRDARGEPTGILREGAQDLVNSKMPKPSPAQRRKAIELAMADAAQHGITSVQDNSSWDDFLVYEQLQREGKLTLRITEWLPFEAPMNVLLSHRSHHSAADPMLRVGMLKGFMDGSLGSRTAALLKPYADEPGNSGLPQFDQAKLNKMTDERAAAGFQIGFHAIGDRGAQMALDAYAEAERYAREHDASKAKREFRFRIEHDQVIAPEQPEQYRRLGVIASVQPNHLLTDMNWAESRIGAERAKHSYPWREFLNNDVRVAFGTDYPVEPITPFRGVYAAVSRMNEAGTQTYYPEQKLTIDEALRAYTVDAAFAEFMEREKGMLGPGMLADLVVLDRDLTQVAPQEILGTKVLRTVVAGKTVYESQ